MTIMTLGVFGGAEKKVIAMCLLVFLAVQVQQVLAVDYDCNYSGYLQPDVTYYVHGPGPNGTYYGRRWCEWYANSQYGSRIRLSCGSINLPSRSDCSGDSITVYVGSRTRVHCGTDWFLDESDGNEIRIRFIAQYASSGRFSCSMQVITPADDNCRCGYQNPTRIVGGVETGVNQFPMMAGLSDGNTIFCGATIISSRYVITAGHCTTFVTIDLLRVLVGQHSSNPRNRTTATREYSVEAISTPPQSNTNSGGYNNDIAIIRVRGIIEFNARVGPSCLPFINSANPLNRQRVVALGWGTTEFAGPQADALQGVILGVVSTTECKTSYPVVGDNQLCTYENGKDSCQMDSGGPNLWWDPVRRVLANVGVIVGGTACATSAPGINNRVGAYMAFIIDKTLDSKYCVRA